MINIIKTKPTSITDTALLGNQKIHDDKSIDEVESLK
jgi:hypothetical protein